MIFFNWFPWRRYSWLLTSRRILIMYFSLFVHLITGCVHLIIGCAQLIIVAVILDCLYILCCSPNTLPICILRQAFLMCCVIVPPAPWYLQIYIIIIITQAKHTFHLNDQQVQTTILLRLNMDRLILIFRLSPI